MIDINFTLVMQMIHFAIAYCIIDRVLLRAAVAVLDQKAQEDALLTNAIQQAHQRVNELNNEQAQRWQEHKKLFKSFMPQILPGGQHRALVREAVEPVTLPPAAVATITREVEDALDKKVSNG